jgi:hypothetical protein
MRAQFEMVQGLRWTLRQDDRAQAVVFFGTRVKPSALVVAGPPAPILVDDLAVAPVLDLAIRLGVVLVTDFRPKTSSATPATTIKRGLRNQRELENTGEASSACHEEVRWL